MSMTIFAMSGSLRADSYNTAALRAAERLAPRGVHFDTFEHLAEIPPFNQDQESSPPEVVADLKRRIRAADAVLFATPEYNYSVPGVLKNAIDWASRPYGDNAWQGKPVSVMGASIGMIGSARAQYHLRQSFVFLDMYPLNMPEVMISNAASRFDDEGNLTDEETGKFIHQMLEALSAWTDRLRKGAA